MRKNQTLRLIIGSIPVLIILGWLISTKVDRQRELKTLFARSISSVVIQKLYPSLRDEQLVLKDGTSFFFFPPADEKMRVGDSVVKQSRSMLYDVYRKDKDGRYKIWATYRIDELY